jgi:hypothetical protein
MECVMPQRGGGTWGMESMEMAANGTRDAANGSLVVGKTQRMVTRYTANRTQQPNPPRHTHRHTQSFCKRLAMGRCVYSNSIPLVSTLSGC